MSTKPVQAPHSTAGAELFSFAEGSCYADQDTLRPTLPGVVYRLFSVGKGLGVKLDLELRSSYFIYYDGDDDYLIAELEAVAPHVRWSDYVYHRWLDQSKVQVLHPGSGRVVAQLETRRYYGRKVRAAAVEAGAHGPNVVVLARSSVPGEPVAEVLPTGGA